MIAAIACVDENWGIGYNGELLERIPEDMKRFKGLTLHSNIIMGRKTWESLPIKPLSCRNNYIISNNYIHPLSFYLDEIINKLKKWHNDCETESTFIIGGASVYKQLLPYCDTIYITHIYKKYDNVDTYFPKLEENEWQRTALSEIKQYNDISYQFWRYDRIN